MSRESKGLRVKARGPVPPMMIWCLMSTSILGGSGACLLSEAADRLMRELAPADGPPAARPGARVGDRGPAGRVHEGLLPRRCCHGGAPPCLVVSLQPADHAV